MKKNIKIVTFLTGNCMAFCDVASNIMCQHFHIVLVKADHRFDQREPRFK